MYMALHERGARKESSLREIAGVPQTVHLDQVREDFDNEMKSLPANVGRVIVSAERCSIHLFTDAQIERLHALLAPYFDSIRVILYLRRQDSHAASRYSQLLRGGMLRAPSLHNQEERYGEAYEYPALLRRWAHGFGRENITARIFQRDTLLEGDVVHDFFSVCGIDRSFAVARDKTEFNPPINLQGQALLLAIGRALQNPRTSGLQDGGGQTGGDEKIWREITTLVTKLYPGQGWRPSRAEAAAFMEQYAESNEIVRREWFPERVALFDLDFSALPEQPISLDEQDVLTAGLELAIAAVRDGVRKKVGNAITKAQTKLKKGRPEVAARLLKRAVRRDANNPDLRMDLARFHADAGEFSLALAHAAAAVKLAPEDEEARSLQRALAQAHPDQTAAELGNDLNL